MFDVLFIDKFEDFLFKKAKEAVLDDGTLKKLTTNQVSKFLSYEATFNEEEDNRVPNFMYLTCFEKKIQCYLFELLSFYDKYVRKLKKEFFIFCEGIQSKYHKKHYLQL